VRRRLGIVLLVVGLATIAWVGVTVTWGDPFTSIYTAYEQRQLAHQLAKDRHMFVPAAIPQRVEASANSETKALAVKHLLRARLAVFRKTLHDGSPIGRIVIPKIGLKMIVVQGTDERDLAKGPGHYDQASGVNTSLPGAGGVVGIAGHRTTFLHPFRYINDLQPGNYVYLEMPYGTFRYKVYAQKIVLPTDWGILRPRPFEKLVLSACHPLYSASHRIVIFARLVGESTKTTF
jgi:sortase A